MRLSKNYIQTIRGTGKEYDSKNHELLTQAGFIDQVASGVYTLLPPGLRVVQKIEKIVREEMNALGAVEVLASSIQPKSLWDQTKRWDSVDVLYKVKSQYEFEYALACTAEEVIADLATRYITSYKDLPVKLYQLSEKFRDEARAKSGILRGRAFRMKDMYSFHTDYDDFKEFYKTVIESYLRIFNRCGFEEVYITEASGGDFTKNRSHEFNVLTPAGEVDLYYKDGSVKAFNEEVVKGNAAKLLECDPSEVKQDKAIEIGNIFDLGTKYSEAFNMKYVDETGKKNLVYGASYGIGITRLLGAIVELNHDEKGMIWPDEVRPYDVHLVNLSEDTTVAELVYRNLQSEGFDVLYDDRDDISAGEKFAIADLIGVPIRLITSDKNGRDVEWKERTETRSRKFTVPEMVKRLHEYYTA